MLALPFPAASFDVVTTGYGLRNVPDLPPRSTKFGACCAGRAVVSLDFNRPGQRIDPRRLSRVSDRRRGGARWMLHGDPDTYRYIPASIRPLSRRRGGRASVRGAWLRRVRHDRVLGGLMAIHSPQRLSHCEIDTSNWSGEGAFTQLLIDRLREIDAVRFVGSRTRRRVARRPTTTSSATSSSWRLRPRSSRSRVKRLGILWFADGPDRSRHDLASWLRLSTGDEPKESGSRTTATRGCCSTCGPSGSCARTRPAATSWSNWSGSTRWVLPEAFLMALSVLPEPRA